MSRALCASAMIAGVLGVFHFTDAERWQDLVFLALSLFLIAMANFIQGVESK